MGSVFTNTLFEASAPGRLDVMGGIADYSGSLVLQMPIQQRTSVSITLRDDYQCHLTSKMSSQQILHVAFDYRELLTEGLADYSSANKYFHEQPDKSWAAYIVGCVLALQKERGIDFRGADFTISSEVPLGKGVSSSASLEVATMKALSKAFDLDFIGTELPTLAQRVENYIVGAPCGLMDQLATYFGKPRTLLPLVCQPDKIEESILLPDDLFFMGIDSGVRHSVGGSSYSDVRCAAFMGYTIIARSLGVSLEDIKEAKKAHAFSSLPYGGYLCNIAVDEFERTFQSVLPEIISGKDFMSRYGLTIDGVTSVQPDTHYSIYNCTSHPVYENNRVHQFRDLLRTINNDNRQSVMWDMGALMYQAHNSYSLCGIGSDRTDEIVNLSRTYKGIYGAKITGGGSGGTVCLLADGEEGRKSVLDIHKVMCDRYKEELVLFDC